MRNWFMEQDMAMYIMMAMSAVGIIMGIAGRTLYGRLAKEAQVCGTSHDPLLRYIRQKFASYYKLGIQPENTNVIVKRYLALHHAGFLPMEAYRYAPIMMSGCIVITAAVSSMYIYQTKGTLDVAFMRIGTGFIMALGVCLIGFLLGVRQQEIITETAIEDYLENYLKRRLDGEYGFSEPIARPEQYEQALKESAATKVLGSRTGRTQKNVSRAAAKEWTGDAVEAKIVEDVLREFLV